MSKKVICILGMHRSGTSCLTGSLQQSGLYLGEVYTKNPFNLKGNREHMHINFLQDDVLEDNGGSWFNPPEHVEWSVEHYSHLCSLVAEFKEYPMWGFKDPRSLFTLPGLQDCIANLQFVGTFRNPYSVASSLQHRNAEMGDERFWLNLWNTYNRRLLELWEQHHFPVVNFDQHDADYIVSLNKLYALLGLKKSVIRLIAEHGLIGGLKELNSGKQSVFFDPLLRTHTSTRTEGLPEDILKTYKTLQSIAL